jgi:hypothetical protein
VFLKRIKKTEAKIKFVTLNFAFPISTEAVKIIYVCVIYIHVILAGISFMGEIC